jgi:hypothetical protein
MIDIVGLSQCLSKLSSMRFDVCMQRLLDTSAIIRQQTFPALPHLLTSNPSLNLQNASNASNKDGV